MSLIFGSVATGFKNLSIVGRFVVFFFPLPSSLHVYLGYMLQHLLQIQQMQSAEAVKILVLCRNTVIIVYLICFSTITYAIKCIVSYKLQKHHVK